jgi:L,D-peptidoglycan transpeptidase YkuD (ErfK/YbiS/YcfS/YnhG family)
MLTKLSRKVSERSTAAMVIAAVLVALTVVVTAAAVRRDGGQPVAVDTTAPTTSAVHAPAPATTTSYTPTTAAPPATTDPATETGQPPVEPTPPAAAPPVTPAQPAPTQAPETQSPAAPAQPPAPAQPAGPTGQPLPLAYSGGAGQVVTVAAPSWGATTATVTAWNRNGDGSWSAAVGPVQARIGSQGIGQASESTSRTPAGTYTLTQAFGRQGDPGTSLPYFQTRPNDWWDENPDSPTYNRHVVQADSPGGASENLYYSGAVYDYAINIDYNTAGTPGAGSAFFLHVTNGAATAGCVAIPRDSLVAILQWIAPGAVIVLGVG